MCALVFPWHSLPRAGRNWGHQHWQLKHIEPQAEAFARGADKALFGLCHILGLCKQHWPELSNDFVGVKHLLMGSLQVLFLYCNWKAANLRLVAVEGHAPPRSANSELWIGRSLRKC